MKGMIKLKPFYNKRHKMQQFTWNVPFIDIYKLLLENECHNWDTLGLGHLV